MIEHSNALKDDITYIRRLAEQGRSAPILGGVFLAGAGAIFGTACFIQWALIIRGVVGVVPLLSLWGGAMVLFALIWFLFFLQMRDRGSAAVGLSNKAFHASWLGSGIGITVASIGVAIAGAVTHSVAVMLAYPPMVFGFYGTAWLATAVLVGRRWMYGAAAGSYLFALMLAVLAAQPWQLPAMGIALYATLGIPGALLMREKAL